MDEADHPSIEQGSIVWAWVEDPRGNWKKRPALILTATDEIILNAPIVAAPITSTFTDPPPHECVLLPSQKRGHPSTRLYLRSVAVCGGWGPIELRPSDILSVEGFLPTKYLIKVLQRVEECHSE